MKEGKEFCRFLSKTGPDYVNNCDHEKCISGSLREIHVRDDDIWIQRKVRSYRQ